MKIKMKETKKGSEDGFTVKTFEEGRTYTTTDWLGKVFTENGWAEPASAGRVKVDEEASSADDGGETGSSTESSNPDPDKDPAANDAPTKPLLEQKPSQWVGKVLLNPDGAERTVEKVNGNQVFFIEEDQSTDYRVVRSSFKAKDEAKE